MHRITAVFLWISLLLLPAACRDMRGSGTPSNQGSSPKQPAEEVQADSGGASTAGPIKQVIIIYTGDTRSIPNANDDYKPPEGGLPALANAITTYEGEILRFNQLRVQNEGGDAAQVRADFEKGMLGDNPYMLLDYGYWERPNDPVGEILVKLYFDMYEALHYSAVGATLYFHLKPEQWTAYSKAAPRNLPLLRSAGSLRPEAIPCLPIVVREYYGKKWGIVSISVPVTDNLAPQEAKAAAQEQMQRDVEAAAKQLENAHCDCAVLMATGGPTSFYERLQQDKRFTVVLGAPQKSAAPIGYGVMPAAGPLMLPALDGGGRALGACHLIYSAGGSKPSQYSFVLKRCIENLKQPYPYRKQAWEASQQHDIAFKQLKAATPK